MAAEFLTYVLWAVTPDGCTEKYAPEIYTKAESSMKQAERLLQAKADKNEIISVARQTVQLSEDSRALAAERQEQERIEVETIGNRAESFE